MTKALQRHRDLNPRRRRRRNPGHLSCLTAAGVGAAIGGMALVYSEAKKLAAEHGEQSRYSELTPTEKREIGWQFIRGLAFGGTFGTVAAVLYREAKHD
jgi:hypothetical protein